MRAWTPNPAAIEEARVLANLTYEQLARKAHVDRGTLSNFLKGRRQPSLGTVHAVCVALGMHPREGFIFHQDEAA